MKKYLLLLLLAVSFTYASAGDYHGDHNNITYVKDNKRKPDLSLQAEMRNRANWKTFLNVNDAWWVEFDERTELPRRAMGKPISVSGSSWENKAINFVTNKLYGFKMPVDDLKYTGVSHSNNYHWVRFEQEVDGYRIFDSELMVKLSNADQVVMIGTRLYRDVIYDPAGLSIAQAEAFATSGLTEQITSVSTGAELMILPVVEGYNGEFEKLFYHLVYNVMVEGVNAENIPVQYNTLVDAVTGKIWYRANEVMHAKIEPEKPAVAAGVIEMDMEANLFTTNSYNTATIEKLANLEIIINGNTFYTDANGFITTTESGPATANIALKGKWSTVFTNNVTPTLSTSVIDGINVVDYTGNATIQELSAYYHVNVIHDHVNFWLPSFTGMDFSLPTNVDLTSGSCNAFYNGSSINFYAQAAGCLSFATVADIVYHEYGHGINDNYYQSQGASFNNGAIGEGYADFWAMSITLNPLLGEGHDGTSATEVVRRYDIDPKVYPDDILGEVHADGEIICGAWWDTYINLGNDMNATMSLFVDAYAGLQATLSNGNEGEAFTNVLIDVLQADDVPGNGGDNDISNGTPNGIAIADAFALHGITLISNASLFHADLLSAQENTAIDISADLTISFPYTQYLGSVNINYRINNSPIWNSVPMTNTGGSTYDGQIPGQPIGTLVSYYISSEDVNGYTSAVEPVGAAASPYPNTPYYILVGYTMVGEDDVADFNQDFGNWTVGLPNDNATTGEWVIAIPLGSFGTVGVPSSIVQTNQDHTTNPGDICFVTGNANTINDPIGTNDVDGGTTTLISPVLDLSVHQNPTISYWKWYTNNPPSGANPKADWWQVSISNDGGSTWIPVENTISGERKWRRFAFRVQDFITPTSTVQLKFNVSDSLHIGQNLDGGSLVEGALDDIRLWDDANYWGVDEYGLFSNVSIYPNPSVSAFQVSFKTLVNEEVRLVIYDATGREVHTQDLGAVMAGEHLITIDEKLAAGYYNLRLVSGMRGSTTKFQVVE